MVSADKMCTLQTKRQLLLLTMCKRHKTPFDKVKCFYKNIDKKVMNDRLVN